MSFVNPTSPNLEDYITYVLGQGVPIADLPVLQTTLTTTEGSETATVGSATGLADGMFVLSQFVSPQTTIVSISGTTVTLSSPATGAGSTLLAYFSADFMALGWTFTIAVDRVIGAGAVGGILYVLAVYNLGLHTLVKISQDISPLTFFADARTQYGILSFIGGIISSTADQNSSNAIATSDLLKDLSVSDLDVLKTPWGREYAGYAQNFGRYVVGVS